MVKAVGGGEGGRYVLPFGGLAAHSVKLSHLYTALDGQVPSTSITSGVLLAGDAYARQFKVSPAEVFEAQVWSSDWKCPDYEVLHAVVLSEFVKGL